MSDKEERYFVHFKSHSDDHYYGAWKNKPTIKQLKDWVKKECPEEWQHLEWEAHKVEINESS